MSDRVFMYPFPLPFISLSLINSFSSHLLFTPIPLSLSQPLSSLHLRSFHKIQPQKKQRPLCFTKILIFGPVQLIQYIMLFISLDLFENGVWIGELQTQISVRCLLISQLSVKISCHNHSH